jgi:hypothetical protein
MFSRLYQTYGKIRIMNSYELSRNWFDWCYENPEKISPNHSALYFFIIEHCNRLGWKQKFGLPTTMAKEAIGIRSYNTYITTLNNLVEFGFIELIEKSKNQYSSNIIALSNFDKAHDKALDKALIKHTTKQLQSIDSINKQETKNNKHIPEFNEFLEYAISQVPTVNKEDLRLKYESWKVNEWKDGNDKKIMNWKTKLNNTLPYIRKDEFKTYTPNIIHE